MGLPCGWVTDPGRALSGSQQNAALGNGVLPLQIIERARKTGHLREDFASQDLILVLMANAGVVAATGASAPRELAPARRAPAARIRQPRSPVAGHRLGP